MEKLVMKIILKNKDNNTLLNDYWQCSNDFKFKYTLKDLSLKSNLSYSKLTRIVENSGYLLVKRLKDCNNCYFEFKIINRSVFLRRKLEILQENFSCYECKKIEIENKAKKLIGILKENLIEHKKEKLEFKELSFLEKIYLYVLLEKYGTYGVVFHSSSEFFTKDGLNGGGFLVQSILQKGYLIFNKRCDFLCDVKYELGTFFRNNFSFFDAELKEEITYLNGLNFDHNYTVLMPSKFRCTNEWIVSLYEDIKISNISDDDIKQLNIFILNKRLKEVYILLDIICNYKKIPVSKDNALEVELIRMLKNYNLKIIFNLLWYKSKFATDKLYMLDHTYHKAHNIYKNQIFRNELSKYLDYLDSIDEKPKYSRRLPDNWLYSDVELFMSAHVVGNYETWENYTPDEILAQIINKKFD